jgi:hypothetical protein
LEIQYKRKELLKKKVSDLYERNESINTWIMEINIELKEITEKKGLK